MDDRSKHNAVEMTLTHELNIVIISFIVLLQKHIRIIINKVGTNQKNKIRRAKIRADLCHELSEALYLAKKRSRFRAAVGKNRGMLSHSSYRRDYIGHDAQLRDGLRRIPTDALDGLSAGAAASARLH